jgi:hypothetical protein
MSRAVCIYRQSQGTDDSVSLSIQREEVRALADELADDIDEIDLGVHTGFSSLTKDLDEDPVDMHPEMQSLEDDLRDGKYDYLLAYDYTRICRDDYYSEIKRRAKQGGCELIFVDGEDNDDLGSDVERTVEKHIKQKEIAKSKQAVEHRMEAGHYQGRPPFGLTLDDAGERLVPGDSFDSALEVLRRRDQDESYRSIADAIEEMSRSKARRIVQNRERYELLACAEILSDTTER